MSPGLPGDADAVWLACSSPTQPPNWAWETSRQNWTAYPAERRTQTCPTPTRRPPSTARIHEGDAVRTPNSTPPHPHLSHPPCHLPLNPPLSASRKEGCGGGGDGGAGVDTVWSPRHPRTQSVPRPLFSTLPPPSPPFLLHLAITPEGTMFFFPPTVTYVRGDEARRRGGT